MSSGTLLARIYFGHLTNASSYWWNLKGDSHCVCAQPSICLCRLMNTSLRIGEEMRDTSMLCFTCSTSLAVLQLGEMCPVPWAVLPGGFWCSAAVCSVGSCPFPSSLKVKSCTQCYCGASDVFQISSLHSNSPHKASFLPLPLKSKTKMERWKKQIQNTCFLSF